jgi:hypothetical protein
MGDNPTSEERFRIEPYKGHFAVFEGMELICVAVYLKGARRVVQRLVEALRPKEPDSTSV